MPVLTAATTEGASAATDDEQGSPLDALGTVWAMVRLWFAFLFSLAVIAYTLFEPSLFPPGYLLFWGALALGSAVYSIRKTPDVLGR